MLLSAILTLMSYSIPMLRSTQNLVLFHSNGIPSPANKFLSISDMYVYALEKSISHKFLISEHTQNEGDTIHSIIEMSMKKAKKSGSIYVPDSFNNQEL